ncbi:MAG: hypothetical protein ACYSVY_17250 [Planctomycetota bacterium]|jgi:hypothetical protein
MARDHPPTLVSPSDPGELNFLLRSTRTLAVAELPGEEGGNPGHYMVRWLDTRGEAGPWSETASATIGTRSTVAGRTIP